MTVKKASNFDLFDTCAPLIVVTKTGNVHKPPANDHKPPANNYKPPGNNHKAPVNDHKPPANKRKPPNRPFPNSNYLIFL